MNSDQIYQAYIGELGSLMQAKAQKRVGWIIKQAEGIKSFLDIGCSQGINSLLLAQRDVCGIGLDIQQESIDYASKLLATEFSTCQDNVTFICSDFLEWTEQQTFDCVILTEVLEHLLKPQNMIEKVEKNLAEGGRVIITVPFGIINHPDHYTVFYVKSLYEMLCPYFDIETVEIFDRWMGIVGWKKGSGHPVLQLSAELMEQEEAAFLNIDKESMADVERYRARIKVTNEQNQTLLESIERQKNKNTTLQESIERQKNRNTTLQEQIIKLKQRNQQLKMQIDELKLKDE